MATLVLDRFIEEQLRADRADRGGDRFDEVWEGVYMMSPLADNEHQEIAARLVSAIQQLVGWESAFRICAGVNITDRDQDWERNYRCPDIAVFAKDTSARDCGTHWLGGPDFAVEILSPQDRSREKLGFYAKVAVRELLLIDRNPWALELYRSSSGQLTISERSSADDGHSVRVQGLEMTLRLVEAPRRPLIEVIAADGRIWRV